MGHADVESVYHNYLLKLAVVPSANLTPEAYQPGYIPHPS